MSISSISIPTVEELSYGLDDGGRVFDPSTKSFRPMTPGETTKAIRYQARAEKRRLFQADQDRRTWNTQMRREAAERTLAAQHRAEAARTAIQRIVAAGATR